MVTKKILFIALAVLLLFASLIGGVYFYTNSSPQQSASPSPSDQPDSSAVPSSSPGETPSNIDSFWTLSILSASANSTMEATLSHDYPKWIVSTENNSVTFLTVEFNLNASQKAGSLWSDEVLLVIDGNQTLLPLCLDDVFGSFQGSRNSTFIGLSLNVSNGKITNNLSIDNFEGSINSLHATFQITVQDQLGGSINVNRQIDSAKIFGFVYIIPKIYLDGTHILELKLLDSSNGQKVTL